ncbi:Calcium-transporting ATPase 10, plasma membrane-type, partial [Clydaea vesicula]
MSFTLEPKELVEFVEPKSPQKLIDFGGVEEVARALKSDLINGLSTTSNQVAIDLKSNDTNVKTEPTATTTENQFAERIHYYGLNVLPPPKSKSFLDFSWEALGDRTLQILVGAAIVEIAIGIYKMKDDGPAGLIDGFAIVFAVVVVVLVTAGNDYRKQSQFRQLSEFSKGLAFTKVIRDGQTIQVKNAEILVGDVVVIDTGDILAADGIFISGSHLKIDESSLTGETNMIVKDASKDPYLLSGTKVVNGVGKMLVIGTGENSVNGRIMMTLSVEIEATPLQKKLDSLANQIGKFGLGSAVLMVVVLVIVYFAISRNSTSVIIKHMINVGISAITLVVVAIPEGLPLAVTIALAHATLRMLKDNNLVRHLSACETMGNATTICSDKTGTLTLNQMTVVKGLVFETDFTLANKKEIFESKLLSSRSEAHKKSLLNLFANSLNVNSSADETEASDGKINFVGSKTDIALLNLTKDIGYEYKKDRVNTTVLEMLPFSSENKKMTTTVKLLGNDIHESLKVDKSITGDIFIYSKGASEIVLSQCDKYIDANGELKTITEEKFEVFKNLIDDYAKQALRTIAIGFKPLTNVSEKDFIVLETEEEVVKEDRSKEGCVLLGIVGIEDPVRPEVPDAVKSCQKAGVLVRMVTGDNKVTAKSIAKQCGILTEDGVVMEGPEFRKLSQSAMDALVPNLQVLARSSPMDKQILVNCLKRIGETVAVTGDGTNDAPALKSADVGFAMGIAGTEVAKEACDIVLLDDNFASLVKAVIWGRSVYDSVRKFLQFQLTVNVTAVVVTIFTAIISTVISPDHVPNPALSAIQLLWVNLIMDTFAALALATDVPTPELLNRKPAKKSDPLINSDMWSQIIGQAVYQIVVVFVIYLKPEAIFSVPEVEKGKNLHLFRDTTVFNVFVLFQLFNEINSRSITKVLIVQLGRSVFHLNQGLGVQNWLICVAFGFGSIPVGFLLRLIPSRQPTDEEILRAAEAEVQDDVYELQRVVIKNIETENGRPLTTRERQLWSKAIRKTATQLRVVEAFKSNSRDAFQEGVIVGAQAALKARAIEDQGEDVTLERSYSRGKELWNKAGTVRRQVGVVRAFRRFR